jgi:exodeoxyribonuclease V gamma subunit
LLAHAPRRDWSAISIGRPKRGASPRQEELGRTADAATDLLADLVAIYDAGRREPLPLPLKTSYAWAEAKHTHGDPEQAAMYRWRSNRYPGEDQEPAHERAWGKGAWLSDLVAAGLDEYACRLWLPMLRALDA